MDAFQVARVVYELLDRPPWRSLTETEIQFGCDHLPVLCIVVTEAGIAIKQQQIMRFCPASESFWPPIMHAIALLKRNDCLYTCSECTADEPPPPFIGSDHLKGSALGEAIGSYLWGADAGVCLASRQHTKLRVIRQSHNTVLTCQLGTRCGYLEYLCADTTRRSECGLVYPEGVYYTDGAWVFGPHETGETTLKYLLDQIELFVLKLDEPMEEVALIEEAPVDDRPPRARPGVKFLIGMRV